MAGSKKKCERRTQNEGECFCGGRPDHEDAFLGKRLGLKKALHADKAQVIGRLVIRDLGLIGLRDLVQIRTAMLTDRCIVRILRITLRTDLHDFLLFLIPYFDYTPRGFSENVTNSRVLREKNEEKISADAAL